MAFLTPSDLPFPVSLTRHPRSRRISVRVHPVKRCVILNVPKRASIERGIAFLKQKRQWIELRLAEYKVSEPPMVADGMELMLFGESYRLRHDPVQRGVTMENGVLALGGGIEFLPRRLRDALVKHAKSEFTRMTTEKLALHPELASRKLTVAVREMASRWGSCTRAGRLCFNWRLVFAPAFVADYLVCHELAHLLHHNHGPRFWALARLMCPRMEEAKRWLRRHGPALYRTL